MKNVKFFKNYIKFALFVPSYICAVVNFNFDYCLMIVFRILGVSQEIVEEIRCFDL